MFIEPFARDRVEENINPIGRLYYAASRRCAVRTPSRKRPHVLARKPVSGASRTC